MPFKQSYWIEGIDWCLNLKSAESSGLKARYRKNQKVICTVNRNDKRKVNVQADRHVVGFIQYPASLKILTALENDEEIYAYFSSIAHTGLVPTKAEITVSTYRRSGPRGPVEPSGRRGPTIKAPAPIQRPVTPSSPHPITGEVFSSQHSKEQVAARCADYSGIY